MLLPPASGSGMFCSPQHVPAPGRGSLGQSSHATHPHLKTYTHMFVCVPACRSFSCLPACAPTACRPPQPGLTETPSTYAVRRPQTQHPRQGQPQPLLRPARQQSSRPLGARCCHTLYHTRSAGGRGAKGGEASRAQGLGLLVGGIQSDLKAQGVGAPVACTQRGRV